MKKILSIVAISLACISCNKDIYADINTDQNTVTKPEPTFLALSAYKKMLGEYSMLMFYAGNRYVFPWAQMTVGDRGSFNSDRLFTMEGRLDQAWLRSYYELGPVVTKMQYTIDSYENEVEKASFQHLYQIGSIMKIMKAIQATDLEGNLVYSEAFLTLDYDQSIITPNYDDQEDLLYMISDELAEAVKILSNPVMLNGEAVNQVLNKGAQDPTYGGNVDSWIKFANSIRLKIAARLIYANIDKAKEIVAEVVKDGNFFQTIEDEFRFYDGKYDNNGGSLGKELWLGSAAKNVVEFMKENRDPRLRFFYSKNPYNAQVMNGLLEHNIEFPDYIKEQVVFSEDGTEFIRWKDSREGEQYPGEPWVRYWGLPEQQEGFIAQEIKDKYNVDAKFQIELGADKIKRVFMPYSTVSPYATAGKDNFTYPSLNLNQDEYQPSGKYPYSFVVLSTAEIKLILALFTTEGVYTGKDANTWFKEGVEASVLSFDKTAFMHNTPYYHTPYDLTKDEDGNIIEKAIGLNKINAKGGEDEIKHLLSKDAYNLTGEKNLDLEKIYIQLMFNSFSNPIDMYSYIKLGGVPKANSTILPRALFTRDFASNTTVNIPRRMKFEEPSKDNQNYDNQNKSLTEQGFIPAAATAPSMNDQRYWFDKKAPAWGAGPISQ